MKARSLSCVQFHLSPSHVGLIFLAFSLPYCLSSPLLGFFADKYPVSLKYAS